MLEICKFRVGFATNSSSSHSLIFFNEINWAQSANNKCNDRLFGTGFGWESFQLFSKEQRARYAAVTLLHALQHIIPFSGGRSIVKDWTGVEVSENEYIDHQSVYVLPKGFQTNGDYFPSKKLFDHFFKCLTQNGLVILGGNDNRDPEEQYEEYKPNSLEYLSGVIKAETDAFNLLLPRDETSLNWICRYDPKYHYWTLFHQSRGSKIRFRFPEKQTGSSGVPVEKAFAPELVDLKITNYCRSSCPFCYQNSGTNGNHAGLDILNEVISALAKLHVFEVAIGGGEPTLHPKFPEILRTFRYHDIVPNFSTRSNEWLVGPHVRDILDNCGAFAFSVSTAEEVQDIIELMLFEKLPMEKLAFHIVMGTVSYDELKAIFLETNRLIDKLNELNYVPSSFSFRDFTPSITLLGFKRRGRGVEYEPEDYSWFASFLQECSKSGGYWQNNIGIDTALAAEFHEELEELDVPQWLFETKEGKFSMYIDATVSSKLVKVGPSSFAKPDQMRLVNGETIASNQDMSSRLIDAFAKF